MDGLFEIPDGARVIPPEPETRDPKLAARQLEKLRQRHHPLSKPWLAPIPLHPDAPPATDRDAPGPRCGSCVFREFILADGYRGKRVPKCVITDHRGRRSRVAHSTATDVRGWWPACRAYEAKPDEAA